PTVSPNAGQPGKPGDFYFYNPTTVAYGKTEFRKNWGNRSYAPDWRNARGNNQTNDNPETEAELTPEQIKELEANELAANARYTPEFYISQLPSTQVE